jgi:hypothetical protein
MTTKFYKSEDKAPPKDGLWILGCFKNEDEEEIIYPIKWNKKKRKEPYRWSKQ